MGEEKKETDKLPYYLTDAELDKKLGVNEKADAPKNYVWAVYFHRAPGCDTCQLMSKYVFATVNERLVPAERKFLLLTQTLDNHRVSDSSTPSFHGICPYTLPAMSLSVTP